ncbi:MAG TPA: PfkB family carbohydrate kinase [Bryobacteraceae bacterium]|jgi:rfaE bifunctional protein kinase chain/domain|nr:PfkB family carbohydrate kinase [Bryobacteraceae bacterium]
METREILAAVRRLSALVVGDICLDRWCTYDPATSEPSRETAIPRIGVVHTEVTAGAAGTVANNLAALGCGRVEVLGVIGDDGFGFELSRALAARGIASDLAVQVPGMQTFTYTKVINRLTGIEDQPRLDFIQTEPLEPAVERQILDRLQQAVDAFDVILISDQAETAQGGVITPAVRDLLADLAPAYPDKIFFADSRTHIHQFRRVIVKPNQQEAETACRALFTQVDYPALRRHTETRLLIVTHGGEGVLLVEDGGETWVKTQPVANPVDICGAGDSFSAGCALALAAGASPADAALFGNRVASITIMKKGTGTASPEEVLARG